MTLYTFTLVLMSALGWSFFDISRKKTGTLLSPLVALVLYMVLSLPIIVVWALLTSTELRVTYWPMATLGIVISFFANWTFIESLRRSPLSQSIPMLSFVPVFSAVLSVIFLGEVLVAEQWLGIAVVVLGAFLLNGMPKFKGEASGPWLMFLAAIFWSILLVIDKISLRSASPPMHIAVQTIGVLLMAFFWIKQKNEAVDFFESMRACGAYLWLGVLGCVMGAGFQLIAIAHTDIGTIESVKRAANLALSLIWGATLFGESISMRKLVSLGVLLLGTFLVLQVI